MLLLPNSVYGLVAYKIDVETGLLLSQHLSFKVYKMYITAIFLKPYKDKNQRCSFKAAADPTNKGKLYSICGTPDISKRSFCDGLVMKFAFSSPQGGIQQAGAPETAAKSITPCFYFRLVITSA